MSNKNKKSGFLSSFYKAVEIFKSLVDEVKNLCDEGEPIDEYLEEVQRNPELRKKLAQVLIVHARLRNQTYTITRDGKFTTTQLIEQVDYDANMVQMIQPNDWPIGACESPGEYEVEFFELPPHTRFTIEVLRAEWKKRGLEQPTIEDALKFGAKYRHVIKHSCPIVFVHKPIEGRRFNEYLYFWNTGDETWSVDRTAGLGATTESECVARVLYQYAGVRKIRK